MINKNICNNISNNGSNDSCNNSNKFLIVWRNKYINNQIINHLKLYKDNYKKYFYSLEELSLYQYKEYIYELFYGGKENICKNDIPSSVERLTISFDIEIKDISISIKALKFENLNKPIGTDLLYHSSILELNFGNCFNMPINKFHLLPLSLTYLNLGSSFIKPLVNGSIPPNVKTLILGSNFRSYFIPLEYGVLPNSITSLSIHCHYYSLEMLKLPSSVTELNLDAVLETPILPGQLPNTIKTLKLNSINKPLFKNSIPNSVTDLRLFESFHPSGQIFEKGIIPSSITSFSCSDVEYLTFKSLPDSIINLELGNYRSPESNIKEIPLIENKSSSIITKLKNRLDSRNNNIKRLIPASVKSLSINLNIFLPLNSLPESITELSLCSNFQSNIIPFSIPNSVVSMYFSEFYNLGLQENSIPPSVTKLSVGSLFPFSSTILPSNIQHLAFDRFFSIPLLKLLPELPLKSLTTLKFHYTFNISKIDLSLFSNTLITTIIIGKNKYKIINNNLIKIYK